MNLLSFPLSLLSFIISTTLQPLSLHDALPIYITTAVYLIRGTLIPFVSAAIGCSPTARSLRPKDVRSEEHTSELQSRGHLVCRLLLEKKIIQNNIRNIAIL